MKLVRKKFLSSMYRKEAGDETSSENELDNISGPSSKVQYIRRGQREVITFVANQITYLSPSPTSSLNIKMMSGVDLKIGRFIDWPNLRRIGGAGLERTRFNGQF